MSNDLISNPRYSIDCWLLVVDADADADADGSSVSDRPFIIVVR